MDTGQQRIVGVEQLTGHDAARAQDRACGRTIEQCPDRGSRGRGLVRAQLQLAPLASAHQHTLARDGHLAHPLGSLHGLVVALEV